jgi:hypothetical protein
MLATHVSQEHRSRGARVRFTDALSGFTHPSHRRFCLDMTNFWLASYCEGCHLEGSQ